MIDHLSYAHKLLAAVRLKPENWDLLFLSCFKVVCNLAYYTSPLLPSLQSMFSFWVLKFYKLVERHVGLMKSPMYRYLWCHATLLLQWNFSQCPIKGCIEDKSSGDPKELALKKIFCLIFYNFVTEQPRASLSPRRGMSVSQYWRHGVRDTGLDRGEWN